MIQAMVWALVLTSGAGMSLSGPIEDADLGGEPPGQPLDLVARHLRGIHHHAALGAAEGDVDDGALPGHPHGEGPHLVERDVRVIADAALGRAAGDVVVDAVALEHLGAPVVHPDRDRDGQLSAGSAKHAADARVQVEPIRGQVELLLRDMPGVDDGAGRLVAGRLRRHE